MSENSTEQQSNEASPNHKVDGAILDAKSRLSIFKDQLVNLSYEVSRSTELDVGLEHSSEFRDPNQTTLDPTRDSLEAPVSTPRSQGGDLPSAETSSSPPRRRPQPRPEDREGSVPDMEAFSEEQDGSRSFVELPEGSSSSSRSWSIGRLIGFGPNGTDLILHRDSTPNPNSTQNRRFDLPFRSTELYPQSSRTQSSSFGSSSRKDGSNSIENWILNSILPFSCWPKEELSDFRWTSMKGQNQPSGKSLISSKQGSMKVSKMNHAVRNAIGKIWDEYSSEISQHLWTVINNLLTAETTTRIDAQSCWISGRAISAVADGLPFAFTIHTFSAPSKPCISGHANVTVEVKTTDAENADLFENALEDYEQRAYGVSSKSVTSLPEPTSPEASKPVQQIQLPDYSSIPPLFPIREQNEEVTVLRDRRRQHKKDSRNQEYLKDVGSESVSTFSFNSITQDKRDQDHPTSGSSDTFSTADLSAFIRHGHHQKQANESKQNPESSSRNKSTTANQKTVFNELDLIWEMQYPDIDQLETVIASRKYLKNEELSHHDSTLTRNTYIGDTDSDLSEDLNLTPVTSTSQDLVLLEDHIEEDHDDESILRDRERSFDRDSDPWDGVLVPYKDPKQERNTFDLTDSMEVNFDDDRDRHRRWGRIHKLSSFVRRVKKLMGTSSSSGGESRRGPQMLSIRTIEAIQESPEPEDRVQYYSPIPSSPSDQRPSHSPSGGNRSTEGFYSAPSTESEPANLEAIVPASTPDHQTGLVLTGGSFPATTTTVAPSSQSVMWDEPRSIKLPVKDLGDGQYLALGHLSGAGVYQISVRIGNKQIKEDLISTIVSDPNSLGSGITKEGPFFQKPDSPLLSSSSTVPVPHPNFPPCHSIAYDPERMEYALRHPHLGFIDLLLIIDCTAGMDRELQQLPTVLQGIKELLKDSVLLKRLKMGVIAYRDHDPDDEDTFLLRKQDLTEDFDKVKRFLNGLEAAGAGDYPEAMEVAFAEAVEGIKWSPFSARFVLWIGDAPPHGYQGFTHKRALEEEQKFKAAKTRLKKAARAVELAMKNEESPQQMSIHDRELADALVECDSIDKYHDKYPLGIPGGVRWEETVERLSSLGVRILVLGLRDAIADEASRNCLRTIAHISGGALLEVLTLDSSVIAPLIVSIVEQALDQQLIEEEVCDLILCSKNDFEFQSLQDKKRNLVESMSQAAKQPFRLQVAPKGSFIDSPKSSRVDHELETRVVRPESKHSIGPTSSRSSGESLGPLTISGGSFDLHSSSMMDSQALLLGMISIRFDECILEQVLVNLRQKAETVSHCLLKNFESLEQWFDFHLSHVSDRGLNKGQRQRVLNLTTPLSLRYILALQTMDQERL